MRLIDRLTDRYRASGYWEGMASGAAVLMTSGGDDRREGPVQTLVSNAQQAYETNGIAFAVILVRMMLLSEATFKFRNKDTKKLYGTQDLRILEYPWPGATTGELIAQMVMDVDTAGNSFIASIEPDRLLRLPPIETTIVSEEVTSSGGVRYRNVIGYDWDPDRGTKTTGDSRAQFFTVDEVSHWSPIPDPRANFRGMSWMTPLLREIGADSGMTFYKTAYLDHGTPITVVRYPAKLKPETIDAVSERIKAKYGGVANAFKPLVLDQGADPTLGKGLQDLDFANVQALGMDRICAGGGVDPVLLGLRGSMPTEQYAAAMRRFGDLTARTLWRSMCASLEKLLPLPSQGVQLWFDTSDIAALQAAETERAQVNQVQAAAILTFVQAGFTRPSAVMAVTSGDLTLLEPDPNAPTPGVNERQTVNVREGLPVTGPESGTLSGKGTQEQQGAEISISKPSKHGVIPSGSSLTKPQTAASKIPAPSSLKTPVNAANGRKT